MYKIYDDSDIEFINRKRDKLEGTWMDDECYAIKEGGKRKTKNPAYTKEKSDQKKREIETSLILGAGTDEQKEELMAKISDPSSPYYNYEKAREARYDAIIEQLDQIYHDIDNNLFGEKAKESKFFNHRKKVKEKAPKK